MFSSSCLEEDCKWTISTTGSSIKLQPFAPPDHLDAKDKWWSEYGANLPDNRAQMKMTSRSTTQKRIIWVPPHHGTRTEYQSDTSHFLQRIWCRAVENDATFLVLNTGNSERIGIRHRATNTLFLTPPLDPFQPPYMRYHMALYASIIDDAFSRLDATEVSQRRNQKRPAPDDQIPTRTSKRLKGEEAQNDVIRPGEDNETEIASRHVLLVSFHFGPFHSPAPSSFLRVSSSCHPSFVSKSFSKPKANRQYSLTKCLNFVAKEKVGQGATGTVYRGSLEMETSSGRILDEDVVLKIPLGNKPIDRIHQEYAVYKQLAEAGVTTGIAKVYGIFEDVETGSIAMMMQYVGTNLLSRERQRMVTAHSTSLCRQITISQIEFDELFNIIKGINDAGILHNDLKPDKIVVDENGCLSIIDFDTTRPMYKPRDYKESPDIVTLRDIFAREFLKDKHYVRW
ncbi:kinase-like domain-containing protein [Panaeolus papilionaceus]|nr:kinase-like domain-containing protein [Panaeolus papilionaceus]